MKTYNNSSNNVRYIRPRKKSAAPFFGLWLFLSFCCLLSAYYFINSSFFSVNKIIVLGNRAINNEEIIENGGLSLGTNLFKVDTKAAVQKIELLPRIKDVKIKRVLFDTLVININERIPVAVVVGPDYYINVDIEGIYLEKITNPEKSSLPVIDCVEIDKDARPGISIKTEGLAAALQMISMMDEVFFENIVEIIAPSPERITLKTLQGVEILFGEPTDMERKIKLIEGLLIKNGAIINQQTVEYIDLRYNTAPVIKRR